MIAALKRFLTPKPRASVIVRSPRQYLESRWGSLDSGVFVSPEEIQRRERKHWTRPSVRSFGAGEANGNEPYNPLIDARPKP